MNIAFDAAAILGPMSKNRGIGNYALAQFKEMVSQDKTNHYYCFNLFEPFTLGDYKNLTEYYFDCGEGRELLALNDKVVFSNLVRQFIKKNSIDVFYITSPFDGSLPSYEKEWFDGVKTVITVYDIIPYVFRKHYFPPVGKLPDWYVDGIDMLKWADKLLVISQSVKDDLIHYLHFNGDNIEVIWGAPSVQFKELDVDDATCLSLQKEYKLKDRFIMCTGGDDDRKNIAGLIKAYGKLPDDLRNTYGLTIVCKLQKESEIRYRSIAKKIGIENDVVFTNYVSNEDLVNLYNMSSLVAFPSKYEGFGLPVTEAWACGKPVLTANNSSLCQIAGDAATLVDADNIDAIAKGLQKALDDDLLKIMADRGKKRLKMFQWPAVAERAIKAINSMKVKSEDQHIMPKLAFFTPLPPQESGIADYSVDVLNVLSDEFIIDVYIDDGYRPDVVFPNSINVKNHRHFADNVNNYDHVLYQMGNSLYHYYMFPYVKKYGGVLVLHDLNMHGVAQAVGLNILKDNFKTYKEYLREDLTEEEAGMILDELSRGRYPNVSTVINGFVSNYADKIIVHSKYAMEGLLHKDIGRTIKHIPHYAKIEPLVDTAMAKKAIGINPSTKVFAAFGHINTTKRVLPLLRAAIQFLKNYDDGIFLFVGKLDKAIRDEFSKTLTESGLKDRIVVTGYTTLEDFHRYIEATDVCFNLRYPYNGESSGSLARILSRGKCVVVNNIGSFGELPDDCCIKLPSADKMTPMEEENKIYKTMVELAESTELREKMSAAARHYAEENLDLNIIGQQYVDFICSNYANSIDEQVIDTIRAAIINRGMYTQEDIQGIARTLAYCIEQ